MNRRIGFITACAFSLALCTVSVASAQSKGGGQKGQCQKGQTTPTLAMGSGGFGGGGGGVMMPGAIRSPMSPGGGMSAGTMPGFTPQMQLQNPFAQQMQMQNMMMQQQMAMQNAYMQQATNMQAYYMQNAMRMQNQVQKQMNMYSPVSQSAYRSYGK